MSVEYKDSGITFENRNFDGVLWYQPRALSESLSDSVTPSDSLIKGIDPVYADSASASDAIVKSFSIPLADSMTPSDDLVKLVSIPLADSVTPSDAVAKSFSTSFADSATPSDEVVKHPSIPLPDSVSVTDSLIKDFGINLSDSVIARDSKYVVFKDRSGVLFESRPGVVWSEYSEDIIKDISKPIDDSVTVNDEIFNHPGKHLTDSATPIDAIIEKDVGKPIVDSITPVDSITTKHFGKVLVDSVTADDTTNVLFKDRSDILFENRNGVVWTETRRDMIVKHIEKPLTDSATPSDLITDKFVTMVLTDSITITDNIYNHPGLFFWDEYEYSDLITVMKLDGTMPYVKPENTAFSEMRIKSIYGREPSNFYEIDEQGEEE
jgi:hypothetical protein